MARGGQRPGAGRKAGSPNKANAERQAEVEASGITPLEYMLTILRDEQETAGNRMWAAEKAAPFVHPKLAAVTLDGEMKHDVSDPLAQLMERIAANGKRIHQG